MSCPDAFPSQKNGDTMSNAVASEMPSTSSHPRKSPVLLSFVEGTAEEVMQYSHYCNRSRFASLSLVHQRAPARQLSDNTRAHDHLKHFTRSHHRGAPTGEILSPARRRPHPGDDRGAGQHHQQSERL